MKNFVYSQPTEIVFGAGTHQEIGQRLEPIARRVLLVYGGHSAQKSGLLDRVRRALEASGIYYRELGDIHPNPRLAPVEAGIDLVRRENLEGLLAVGGGSVIDTAKAIAAGAPYPGEVWDFFCGKATPQQCLPVVTLLTIPAAGSEASDSCVLTREQDDRPIKKGFHTPLLRPRLSILDPTLT